MNHLETARDTPVRAVRHLDFSAVKDTQRPPAVSGELELVIGLEWDSVSLSGRVCLFAHLSFISLQSTPCALFISEIILSKV